MKGHVWIYQGSQLLQQDSNTIHANLYDYLFGRLTAGTNKGLQNLFEEHMTQEEAQGQDGIIYQEQVSGDWFALRSSFLTASSSHSKRISGFLVPDEALTLSALRLGFQLADPISVAGGFDTQYATYAPAEALTFFANVPILIVWEISIERS